MEMLLMSYLAGHKSITKNIFQKWISNKIVLFLLLVMLRPYTGYIDEGVEDVFKALWDMNWKLLIFLNMMKII